MPSLQMAYDRARVGTRAAQWLNPRKDEVLIPTREAGYQWIASFNKQLETCPKNKRAEILIARSMVMEALGDPEMIQAAQAAWNYTKTSTTAHMMAVAYHHIGNLKEACKYYDQAHKYPHEEGFNVDLAFVQSLLFQGKWSQANKETLKLKKRMVYAAYLPEWKRETGELSLVSEGGFGDWVQVLRFIPLLQEKVAKLTAYLPPMFFESGFCDLLRDQPWCPELKLLTDTPQKVPAVGIFDLPAVFNVQPNDIPAPLCIKASPELVEKYRDVKKGMFPNAEMPTVGLCWAASQTETPLTNPGTYRSLTESQADSIVRTTYGDIRWVNLQKDLGMDQLSGVIVRPCIGSWSDTAAIIENLDAVVSVDTAVAHLAASMGKTVLMPLAGALDWKYGLHETECPWYPTMRLFKSHSFGFNKAVQDLIEYTKCQIAPRPLHQ